MAEIKSIKEKSTAFDSESSGGMFKASSDLKKFGENQNEYNTLVDDKLEELTRRICTLEAEQQQNKELFKRLANEMVGFKNDIDRLKLTAKLNTNTIDRLVKAIDIASTASGSETETKEE